jgi:hypothetical protein
MINKQAYIPHLRSLPQQKVNVDSVFTVAKIYVHSK